MHDVPVLYQNPVLDMKYVNHSKSRLVGVRDKTGMHPYKIAVRGYADYLRSQIWLLGEYPLEELDEAALATRDDNIVLHIVVRHGLNATFNVVIDEDPFVEPQHQLAIGVFLPEIPRR